MTCPQVSVHLPAGENFTHICAAQDLDFCIYSTVPPCTYFSLQNELDIMSITLAQDLGITPIPPTPVQDLGEMPPLSLSTLFIYISEVAKKEFVTLKPGEPWAVLCRVESFTQHQWFQLQNNSTHVFLLHSTSLAFTSHNASSTSPHLVSPADWLQLCCHQASTL